MGYELWVMSYLMKRDRKERELIKALEVGENSGFVEDFDPKQNLTELQRLHSIKTPPVS